MKFILNKTKDIIESLKEEPIILTDELRHPKFFKKYGCTTLSKPPDMSLKEFNICVKSFTDKTGYEYCDNDRRINDYFEEELSQESAVFLTIQTITIWMQQLKIMQPDKDFCFLFSLDDENCEYVTFRFHQFREEDGFCISINNMEGFLGPVCYITAENDICSLEKMIGLSKIKK